MLRSSCPPHCGQSSARTPRGSKRIRPRRSVKQPSPPIITMSSVSFLLFLPMPISLARRVAVTGHRRGGHAGRHDATKTAVVVNVVHSSSMRSTWGRLQVGSQGEQDGKHSYPIGGLSPRPSPTYCRNTGARSNPRPRPRLPRSSRAAAGIRRLGHSSLPMVRPGWLLTKAQSEMVSNSKALP